MAVAESEGRMKYCNLNCKYLHTSIIERCGEGIGYEYRCRNQKGMPKVTIDTYCPYDEISETTQETNIEIKELKQELDVYKKAFKLLAKDYCEDMGCSFCNHHTKCLEVCHFEDIDGKEFLQEYFLKKAREEL